MVLVGMGPSHLTCLRFSLLRDIVGNQLVNPTRCLCLPCTEHTNSEVEVDGQFVLALLLVFVRTLKGLRIQYQLLYESLLPCKNYLLYVISLYVLKY